MDIRKDGQTDRRKDGEEKTMPLRFSKRRGTKKVCILTLGFVSPETLSIKFLCVNQTFIINKFAKSVSQFSRKAQICGFF